VRIETYLETVMLIGVPKEIKDHEYRAGLVPASIFEAVYHGHDVLVETNLGTGTGISDADYQEAGATVADSAEEVFERADMIVKVKEPQAVERKRLKPGQILFAYLHLAPDAAQTKDLVDSGAVCIAYETVTSPRGGLPLLAPMSEVAGRMSVQAGAHWLERAQGGRGVLLGGVPGVEPARAVVLGGGVVGSNATAIAVGMGADVVVIDRSAEALKILDARFGSRIKTVFSTHHAIERYVTNADMVIGGVLVPGTEAPKLVSAELVKRMMPGSVIIDVAIDQGGCFETSHATTHSEPTYVVDGVTHYCVANMPGGVARTSTFALSNVTLPHLLSLADKGYERALKDDPHLRAGLNVHKGAVTYKGVAEALGYDYHEPLAALGG